MTLICSPGVRSTDVDNCENLKVLDRRLTSVLMNWIWILLGSRQLFGRALALYRNSLDCMRKKYRINREKGQDQHKLTRHNVPLNNARVQRESQFYREMKLQ